ncbi:hypothetical protein BDR07DRAFT_480123 [Suillus spraguei]|nr:hypothetical protein BDR07DRAFT_480123 [Suillus spraguei]
MVFFLEVVRRLLTHLQRSLSVNSGTALSSPARTGILFATSGIGSLLGAPICGAILTSDYIWWKPAVFAGGVATAGSILLASIKFISKTCPKTASVCTKETTV